MIYFATFPAGTYDIIVKHLKRFTVDELKIVEHDDSSVVFRSPLPAEKLIELRYFTNVYLEVGSADATPKSVLKGKHFRLMMLKNGAPHPIDTAERAKLEVKIKHNFSLEPNSHLSRNDFYLIERSSGKKLFTLRLPRAKFKREKLATGELRPELAHILCLAAGIKAKHSMLDAFAGYGAIPLEAVRGFGCKSVIAVDNQELPKRHTHPSIQWHTANARNLDFLADNSIDRIVTDPPWGAYDAGAEDLPALYADFTKELLRVLKPDGVTVILTGYNQATKHFKQSESLKLIGTWSVLVSGKKANIYKLQKVK